MMHTRFYKSDMDIDLDPKMPALLHSRMHSNKHTKVQQGINK